MDGVLFDPANCRTCGERILFIHDSQPLLQVECPACGFINITEQGTVRIPVRETLKQLVPDEIIRAYLRDGAWPGAVLFQTLRWQINRIIVQCRRQPAAARALLWPYLNERERLADLFQRGDNRVGTALVEWNQATQMLLGWIMQDRPPDLEEAAPPIEDRQQLFQTLNRLMERAAELANYAKSIKLGLAEGVIYGGEFHLVKSDHHSRMLEWDLNRDRFLAATKKYLPNAENLFADESLRAQKIFLGFSTRDVLELLYDWGAKLRAEANTFERNEMLVVELDIPWRDEMKLWRVSGRVVFLAKE